MILIQISGRKKRNITKQINRTKRKAIYLYILYSFIYFKIFYKKVLTFILNML